MHHPRVFRLVHRTHHHSRNPSPWAAYSFSPVEAVVEAGIFPLVVMTIPIHPGALSLFLLWQIVFNVIGHTGFEYHPQRFMDSPVRFLFNTPTNHIMHHESAGGNFGLYFNVWDRLMGTNQRAYQRRFRSVTARRLMTEEPVAALVPAAATPGRGQDGGGGPPSASTRSAPEQSLEMGPHANERWGSGAADGPPRSLQPGAP
jgi:sterol desaturase/sphingolipid hydroxylase (fatty acid hydroxylase superfamily)